MKVGSRAVPIQRVEASRRRDDIHQSLAISLFEDAGDFLKAVIHFPAGSFPPEHPVPVENDAVGVDLIPGEDQRLSRQIRQLFPNGVTPCAGHKKERCPKTKAGGMSPSASRVCGP